MTQINLLGLHHFDEITPGCLLEALQNPGVYIWGFLAEKGDNHDHKILCYPEYRHYKGVIDESFCFIPYYVGESSSSISDRLIKDHHQPTKNPANKYTRITNGYFKGFINSDKLPFGGTKSRKKIVGYFYKCIQGISPNKYFGLVKSQVIYNNIFNFLQGVCGSKIFPKYKNPVGSIAKSHFPITDQNNNGAKFDDILHEYINVRNNFYFLYAPYNGKTTELEAVLYFQLVGFTIGSTKLDLNQLVKKGLSNQYSINLPYGINILKSGISDDFDGF